MVNNVFLLYWLLARVYLFWLVTVWFYSLCGSPSLLFLSGCSYALRHTLGPFCAPEHLPFPWGQLAWQARTLRAGPVGMAGTNCACHWHLLCVPGGMCVHWLLGDSVALPRRAVQRTHIMGSAPLHGDATSRAGEYFKKIRALHQLLHAVPIYFSDTSKLLWIGSCSWRVLLFWLPCTSRSASILNVGCYVDVF